MLQAITEIEEVFEKVKAFYAPDSLEMWITTVDKEGNRRRHYSKSDEKESNVLGEFCSDYIARPSLHKDSSRKYEYIKREDDGFSIFDEKFRYQTHMKDVYERVGEILTNLKRD